MKSTQMKKLRKEHNMKIENLALLTRYTVPYLNHLEKIECQLSTKLTRILELIFNLEEETEKTETNENELKNHEFNIENEEIDEDKEDDDYEDDYEDLITKEVPMPDDF